MSSAGVCSICGKTVDKRYGGEGRYLPECIDCWTETPEAHVAREDRAAEVRLRGEERVAELEKEASRRTP